MKNTLLASTAAFAMVASMASAGGHLAFGTEGGPFSWDSYDAWAENAPDLSGQTVTVFGPWLTPEDGYLNNALAYFEEATGADVIYTGSDSFEQQIVIDAEAGSAPNVAVFPQPGLAAVMASKGQLFPLPADMGDWVRDNYAAGQSWVDLG
ncbi:MAG: extracellular solute-binding protein, partial [Pseudomonadota bacterium]